MIEICCGSYEDAITAYKEGMQRIELNSALYLGGLTPSAGTLKLVKRDTNLEVICMVRNRGAGFYYSEVEYEVMKEDLKYLLENGADGIAFGFLNNSFEIDTKRTKEFVDIIHSYHKTAVFHRAFDVTKDPYKSIECLISLGVDRILTSGQKPTAYEGKELIKDLIERYGNTIQILPGSGINSTNIKEIKEYTKATQVHSSCKEYVEDITTTYQDVSFSYHNNEYEAVSYELINNIKENDNEY